MSDVQTSPGAALDPPLAATGPARLPATVRSRRVPQIDVLKGLAILGVMAQHAFAAKLLRNSWAILYADQAVPIFFVLMGLNATRSALSRPAPTSFGAMDSRRYWIGRIRRLVLPVLWMWPLAAVAAIVAGQFHVGPLLLVGVPPMQSAPGSYFITITFEFAILFPIVLKVFRRAPITLSAVIVAVDIGYEMFAAHVHTLGPLGPAHGYFYTACILKYGCAILAGMWLGRVARRDAIFWLGLGGTAVASVVYLVLLHQDPQDFTWLPQSFSITTNFISVFYGVLLTCLGLRFLTPRQPRILFELLERLGVASYHIFIVQMVWFGIVGIRSWSFGILGIAVSCAVGYLFFWLLEEPARLARLRELAEG